MIPTDEKERRRRLYHLATMAGSLAPKGTYGLPSEEMKAKNRAAWKAAPLSLKLLNIAFGVAPLALVGIGAWALLTDHDASALVAVGLLLLLMCVVAPTLAIHESRRAAKAAAAKSRIEQSRGPVA